MKSTGQYLDAVKDRLDLPSDYAIAKALNVTRAAISSYRTGRSMPDDLVCARIAAVIGVEPMEVIAAINYQRAKNDDARSLWESIWGKAAGYRAELDRVRGWRIGGSPLTCESLRGF